MEQLKICAWIDTIDVESFYCNSCDFRGMVLTEQQHCTNYCPGCGLNDFGEPAEDDRDPPEYYGEPSVTNEERLESGEVKPR